MANPASSYNHLRFCLFSYEFILLVSIVNMYENFRTIYYVLVQTRMNWCVLQGLGTCKMMHNTNTCTCT